MNNDKDQRSTAEAACSQCGSSDAETIRHITRRGWGGSTRTVQLRCNQCGMIYEGASEPAMKKFQVAVALLLMVFVIGLVLAVAIMLPCK